MEPGICSLVDSDQQLQSSCSRKKWTCNCRKCFLLRQRRSIIRRMFTYPSPKQAEVAVGEEDEMARRLTYSRYTCSRCRRHGLVAMKKFHQPCPFLACACEACALNTKKTRIEDELALIHRDQRLQREQNQQQQHHPSANIEITDVHPLPLEALITRDTALTPDAQIILGLLRLLAEEDSERVEQTADFDALARLFSQPTIDLPQRWMPYMEEIISLVTAALAKIPRLSGIDFTQPAVFH